MFSHAFTLITGIILGSLFFANTQITKLLNPDMFIKWIGLSGASLNTRAFIVMGLFLTIGLGIRAIARSKGAQRTGGK